MKNILFFYPDNPALKNSGNRTRALQLLEYFKSRGFSVNLVSTSDWSEDWNTASVDWLLHNKLANKVHILYRKPFKKNIIKYFFSYKIPNLINNKKGVLPDLASQPLKQQFNKILQEKRYDYIVISYVQWANLIRNNPLVGHSKTIIDTHDFITSQFQNNKHFQLGASFEEEIKRLQLFDEVWAISSDEQFVFSQFCKGNHIRLVSMSLNKPNVEDALVTEHPFDLIYVASDNPNNRRSANWFFNKVYPILPENINICIVGKITNCIDDYPNVTKIPFAENLDPYYQKSRIVLCPMLEGTGIKIKVVEAFAYGLPVVGTLRAIDGLPNKIKNGCLISDDPAMFAEHIKTLLSDKEKYQEQHRLAKVMFDTFFNTEVGYLTLDKAFGV